MNELLREFASDECDDEFAPVSDADAPPVLPVATCATDSGALHSAPPAAGAPLELAQPFVSDPLPVLPFDGDSLPLMPFDGLPLE